MRALITLSFLALLSAPLAGCSYHDRHRHDYDDRRAWRNRDYDQRRDCDYRYGYDYRRGLVRPSVDELDPPVFSCVVNATTPVPTAPPRVTWRAGLDLDPVDPMIAARAARRGRQVAS